MIHNPQKFRLTEAAVHKLRQRFFIVGGIFSFVWLLFFVLRLARPENDPAWWLQPLIFGALLLSGLVRYYRTYRYQRDWELTIDETGLSMNMGFKVVNIHYTDLGTILKTKKHLLITGRYPDHAISVPQGMENYEVIENHLRKMRPITETGKPLPLHYARQFMPNAGKRNFYLYFIVIFLAVIAPLLELTLPPTPRLITQNRSETIRLKQLPFSPVDSFAKYPRTDSLIDYAHASFYTGKLHGIEFGIYQQDTGSPYFCLKEGGTWKMPDQFQFPVRLLYEVKVLDVNGDGYKDIRVNGESIDAEQDACAVLLFEPKAKRFVHRSAFDLPEIAFDTIHGFVTSEAWNEALSGAVKETYRPSGDSLVFLEGVQMVDTIKGSDKIQVEFFNRKNGVKTIRKTYRGTSEEMWNLFVKSLWNSSE